MKKQLSQNEMIRKHLMSGKKLTAVQAFNKFRCMRLASRIHDLRSDGMLIDSRNITKDGVTFAEYRLIKD